ncbi:hypothetical protein ACWPKS_06000 [Coraliomargarita sp. W4R72]
MESISEDKLLIVSHADSGLITSLIEHLNTAILGSVPSIQQ